MEKQGKKAFWAEITAAGRLLRPSEVVSRTGLSRSQIYQMISEGRFPPFVKLSTRASALPESWLEEFVKVRAADTLREHGGRQIVSDDETDSLRV